MGGWNPLEDSWNVDEDARYSKSEKKTQFLKAVETYKKQVAADQDLEEQTRLELLGQLQKAGDTQDENLYREVNRRRKAYAKDKGVNKARQTNEDILTAALDQPGIQVQGLGTQDEALGARGANVSLTNKLMTKV